MKKYVYLFALLFALITTTYAQNKVVLKVSGEVATPLQLTLKELATMPHHTVLLDDKSGKQHTYKGVLVADILTKANAVMGKELRGKNLSKYLVVKCADGYQVVFALAELDSSYTTKEIILADESDGKPLPEARGPLRIIVANEKKNGRSCFKVLEFFV
jgi:DMSO/TMAO reductase YedYZ molybdopterin-dependent catalytic subunit